MCLFKQIKVFDKQSKRKISKLIVYHFDNLSQDVYTVLFRLKFTFNVVTNHKYAENTFFKTN